MRRRRAKRAEPETTLCSTCHGEVPVYDSVNFGTAEKGYRQLCWRCFNTEVAAADGLEHFQHHNFQPIRLTDCEGHTHEFRFRTRLFGTGVSIDAFELRAGQPAGYQYQIIGDPNEDLFPLFGRLVEKIRRGLGIKHLKQEALGLHFNGQCVRGRILWDDRVDGRLPLVLIDGREISWEAFGRMWMTFEGWQFRLQILDPSDEA